MDQIESSESKKCFYSFHFSCNSIYAQVESASLISVSEILIQKINVLDLFS